VKPIDYLKQHKYQTLLCTGMMDSYLLLQKTKKMFSFPCTFSVHCLRENAREETVEAIAFTWLTDGN